MVFTAAILVATMVVKSMGQAQQKVNQANAKRANDIARYKQMAKQFEYDTQNTINNKVAIEQQRVANDVKIEHSKLEAEDIFAQTFAGSGVSGRSIDSLESKIASETAKAHEMNKHRATSQEDRNFMGLMRESQQIRDKIEDTTMFDADAETANQKMAMLGNGLSAVGSWAGSSEGQSTLKGMF